MLSPAQSRGAAGLPCVATQVFGVVDRPASNSAAARVAKAQLAGQHHLSGLGVFATEGASALFALALDSGRRGRVVGDGYPHLPPPTPTEEAAGKWETRRPVNEETAEEETARQEERAAPCRCLSVTARR